MNKMKKYSAVVLVVVMMAMAIFLAGACGKKTDEGSSAADVDPGEIVTGERMKLPLIAWGADVIAIYANGNSAMTKKGSLFDQAGLNFELFREDNFEKQVDLFIRGEIAFLRGTMGMINMAMDRLSASPATRPVLVFQHSWSAGGGRPGGKERHQLRGRSEGQDRCHSEKRAPCRLLSQAS